MPEKNTDKPQSLADELAAVARLYYTGSSTRRYRRASTQDGPGEPLCLKSLAIEVARREAAKARSKELERIVELAKREAIMLAETTVDHALDRCLRATSSFQSQQI